MTNSTVPINFHCRAHYLREAFGPGFQSPLLSEEAIDLAARAVNSTAPALTNTCR